MLVASQGSIAQEEAPGGLLRVPSSHFDHVVVSPAMLADHSCRRLKRALNALLAPEWRGSPSPRPPPPDDRARREWGDSSVSEDSTESGEVDRNGLRVHLPTSLLPAEHSRPRHSAAVAEDIQRRDLPRRPDVFSASVLAFVGAVES